MTLHRMSPNEYDELVDDINRMKNELEDIATKAVSKNLPIIPTCEQVGRIFMCRRMDVLLLALEALKTIKPTSCWTADIGSTNIDLPGVGNLSEALNKANEICLYNDEFDDPYVHQIYCNGEIVWCDNDRP